MDDIIVYCNVDSRGNIIDACVGRNITLIKEYDHIIHTNDEDILINILRYKVDVANSRLVLK